MVPDELTSTKKIRKWIAQHEAAIFAILTGVLIVALVISLFPKINPPTVAPTTIKTMTDRDYQKGKPFRMVIAPRTHPVHKLMMQGFLDACKDKDLLCAPLFLDDVTLDVYVSTIESTVSLGSSGVIMNLGAPVLYNPGINMVKAGFPVISAHGQINQKDIPGLTAWIAADSALYAKKAAAEMAKITACKGPIADNQSGHSDQEDMVGNTFRSELTKLCPGIVILEMQAETVEPTKGTEVDAAILAAHPDLKGAFSTTGGGSTTWTNALKEAGKKPGDVKVISMDYSRPNLTLLKEGWVHALVAQPLYEEFYQGTILLLNKLKGLPVTYENPLDAPLIFAADADKYLDLNTKAGN